MGFMVERDSKEISELNIPGKWIPAKNETKMDWVRVGNIRARRMIVRV
jgi:hypothetical protein